MNEPQRRPIFVVGSPRSGTTMLRYMLSAHSRIYIPPESNFIPRFFAKQPTVELDRQRAIDVVRSIMGYRVFFKDWRGGLPDPAELVDELELLTPAAIVDAVFRRYASQFDAPRWGDKSPMYACHMDTLDQIFPEAQFVHIVRDGRDVALSMLRAYATRRFFYVDPYYAARTWKRYVNSARTAGARIGPDRYFELRYEELVRHPQAVLGKLCAFLDERYEPPMTRPEEVARGSHHSKGIHAATREPVTHERAGGWRTGMDARDRATFVAVAGDLLAELGYDEKTTLSMSGSQWARFVRLRAKYTLVGSGRTALQATGMFHPTEVLTHLGLRPYAKAAPR